MSYSKEQPQTISSLFDAIAVRYDLTNSLLSFGLHKLWNRALVKSIPKKNSLLDLCAGTGQIAFTYLDVNPETTAITLVDFSEAMLNVARQAAPPSSCHLTYVQADVEQLPLRDHSFETATIAYGIRNVKTPLKCFQEVLRTLKPGGTFGILELTRPRSSLLAFLHRSYLRLFLPLLGTLTTRNRAAYRYLAKSISSFYSGEELKALLLQAGFKNVLIRPLFGGIATLWIAQAP